jgi:hypothetical protein
MPMLRKRIPNRSNEVISEANIMQWVRDESRRRRRRQSRSRRERGGGGDAVTEARVIWRSRIAITQLSLIPKEQYALTQPQWQPQASYHTSSITTTENVYGLMN